VEGGMMGKFDAKVLALKPEQLESGRLADTGIAATKRKQRRREFALITRDQFERLAKTTNAASWRIFLHLLLLSWRSPGRVVRLANGALERVGVNRQAKYRALPELEGLGLIGTKDKRKNKSPEAFILDLNGRSSHSDE
jgi:hypothetical protein